MRRALLIRDDETDHGTRGVLTGGGLRLHVMEPPPRNNRPNRSSIPAGAYRVRPHRSPRFGRVLLVTHVPGRSHILFHTGNVGGDRELGLRTHTLGCLLPGLGRARILIAGRRQRAVTGSRTAFRRLMAWAGDHPFDLEIIHA